MNSRTIKSASDEQPPPAQTIWIAEQEFRCLSSSGKSFSAIARIGMPTRVEANDGLPSFGRCQVSLLPIAAQRSSGGINEFQALCLAIEFIRNAFKSYVAEGGKVYFGVSDNPANLDSAWFAPLLSLAELAGEVKAYTKPLKALGTRARNPRKPVPRSDA